MLRTIVLAGVACVLASAAFTQEVDRRLKFNQKRFSGFQGVAFACTLDPENAENTALCKWAQQKAKITAQSLNIPFVILPNNYSDRMLFKIDNGASDYIDLDFDLFTNRGGGPIGAVVSLKAQYGYAAAVEEKPWSELDKVPRPGNLTLWEKRFIAATSSRNSEFETNIRQYFETDLLEFMGDFGQGREPKK